VILGFKILKNLNPSITHSKKDKITVYSTSTHSDYYYYSI